MIDEQQIDKCKKLIAQADHILIAAGAGMSVPAGINYHDTKKFAQLYPGLVKKGYSMQYELITQHAIDDQAGWSAAVKWGYLAAHVNYMLYKIQQDATYQNLYSLVKNKNYFVITTNVDELFADNGFLKDHIYTAQGSFSKLQCLSRCTEQTWDIKPIIDKILPHINPKTQEVTNPSCLPVCPNCGGDVFLNVRGGSWFIDSPYQKQLQQFNNWQNNLNDKNILVLDIGTGFNTPGVVKWPAENIVRKYSNSSLVRVNLYDARIADDIKDRSVSIDGDIAEFLTKIASS